MASVSGGVVSGAGQGASAGSVAGPWGALIGGVAGGVAGGLGANSANKDAKKAGKKLAELQAQANKDNAQRYNDALTLSDQNLIDTNGALNNQYSQIYGMQNAIGLDAPLARNTAQTNAAKGASDQSLISRGLYNSTIGNNAQNAIQVAGDRSAENIRNTNLQQSIGQHQAYTGLLLDNINNAERQKYGTITNRTDAAPNMSAYGSLLSQPQSNAGTDVLGSLGSFSNAYSSLMPQQQAGPNVSSGGYGGTQTKLKRNADGSYSY